MEQKFCQSCGMPLTNEILGTNADGTKNEEYCIYCYKDGAFTDNLTMEEMVESCAQYVDDYNKNTGQNLTQEELKSMLRQFYPTLKRWQLPTDQLPPATSPIKQQLLEEVNTFGINGLPKIDNLFVLQAPRRQRHLLGHASGNRQRPLLRHRLRRAAHPRKHVRQRRHKSRTAAFHVPYVALLTQFCPVCCVANASSVYCVANAILSRMLRCQRNSVQYVALLTQLLSRIFRTFAPSIQPLI